MLHFFLRYETGMLGLIGANFHDIPLPVSLLLMLVYIFIPYLLGSVNTAIIVSGAMYHDDVRNHGSGNAGFTNMMRNYGKKAAIITFVGDILKTVLAVLIGWCVFGVPYRSCVPRVLQFPRRQGSSMSRDYPAYA